MANQTHADTFMAEEFLRGLGIRQPRVRRHGNIARIEVEQADLPKLMADDVRRRVSGEFRALGYSYVTVDLEGFRSGSINDDPEGLRERENEDGQRPDPR